MKKILSFGLLVVSTLAFAAPPDEILVFGAASLTESLQELGKQFEASAGTKVAFSFASSSDLARQIEAGAPADVFFSADTAKMDALEKAGLVRAGDRREFLSNVLVVVVPSDSAAKIASAKDLAALPKLALADPSAVPAGIYARKWLTQEGVWDSIERKVVPTLDVRAALAAVAGGDIPAGIVYRTDAAVSKEVRIAYTVTNGPAITYSLAPVAASKHAGGGREVRPLPRLARRPRRLRAPGIPDRRDPLISDDVSILLLTVRVAVIATLLILPLGVAAAWALSRRGGPLRTLAETLLSLPLVLPPTAVGILLLDALRRRSALGGLLARFDIEVLFTTKAVVLATAVMAFPLLVRPARAAFEEVDRRLPGIARSLGCGPFEAFRRVTLPLAGRGILTGTLLAFSRALGEFGATIIVAGNIPGRTQTMALAIFQRHQIGQDADAMRLVWVTVVIAFAAVLASELLGRRRREEASR